jgi:hypothetical protein
MTWRHHDATGTHQQRPHADSTRSPCAVPRRPRSCQSASVYTAGSVLRIFCEKHKPAPVVGGLSSAASAQAAIFGPKQAASTCRYAHQCPKSACCKPQPPARFHHSLVDRCVICNAGLARVTWPSLSRQASICVASEFVCALAASAACSKAPCARVQPVSGFSGRLSPGLRDAFWSVRELAHGLRQCCIRFRRVRSSAQRP